MQSDPGGGGGGRSGPVQGPFRARLRVRPGLPQGLVGSLAQGPLGGGGAQGPFGDMQGTSTLPGRGEGGSVGFSADR